MHVQSLNLLFSVWTLNYWNFVGDIMAYEWWNRNLIPQVAYCVEYKKYEEICKIKPVFINKQVIIVVLQELCLLEGICKHKDINMVVVVPPLMETTTMATGSEAGSTIIMGIMTFVITTGQNMVSMLMSTTLITVTMFSTMLCLHLWKGENIQLLVGKTTRNTIFLPLSTAIFPLPPLTFKNLLQGPMSMLRYHLYASLIVLYLKIKSRCLCQGMRLIDVLHQEKMVLMYFTRDTCATPTVPSFKILGCGLTCKIHIAGRMLRVVFKTINIIKLLDVCLWYCYLRLKINHLSYTCVKFDMFLCRPQTTIGTAMVLCHRFFVRRSHACHDRFVSLVTL